MYVCLRSYQVKLSSESSIYGLTMIDAVHASYIHSLYT